MTKNEVIELMKSSKSESEWNRNCDKVKASLNGYPDYWYQEIIISGVAYQVQNSWG